MNENELEHEGVSYVAVAVVADDSARSLCSGCFFNSPVSVMCHKVKCGPMQRADERHVIFVEKQS